MTEDEDDEVSWRMLNDGLVVLLVAVSLLAAVLYAVQKVRQASEIECPKGELCGD